MNNTYINKELLAILDKYSPMLVYYFGSASRDKMGPMSDIDLAVLWPENENTPMVKSLILQNEIQSRLNNKKYEIGCLNNQSLSFCYSVISTGRCIYGSDPNRVAYETKILDEYLDFGYLSDIYNKEFDKRILKNG
ncbi:nucleotidyltransferase domain-containing protein [Candidatus Saganbacteria bacterium]|nr:nucleotidyltransferase domain-containing protein [Candidatus Saganbacteria bacterium]